MKLLFILMLAIFLQACALQKPKYEVIYMNSPTEQWRKAKLYEYGVEVQVIVLAVFEGRISTSAPMTKEEVEAMHAWLMDRCVMYHKLTI